MATTAGGPRLRLATERDAAACAAIYAPYVRETAVSFELEPPDATEMAARIARTLRRMPWVVAEVDGVVRAYAYATRHRDRAAYDWTAETTVYVDRDHARRGLGRAAMRGVIAVLRLQGAHLAVAGITPPNPGSIGLHEALGFRPVGTFEAIGWKQGRWHGVAWYELELGPRTPDPAPLVPLPDLDADALAAALAAAAAPDPGPPQPPVGQATDPSSSG